jgi:hypothetical protein
MKRLGETLKVGDLVAVWSSWNVRRAVVVLPVVPGHCDKVRVRLLDGAKLERVVFAETVQRLSDPESV